MGNHLMTMVDMLNFVANYNRTNARAQYPAIYFVVSIKDG